MSIDNHQHSLRRVIEALVLPVFSLVLGSLAEMALVLPLASGGFLAAHITQVRVKSPLSTAKFANSIMRKKRNVEQVQLVEVVLIPIKPVVVVQLLVVAQPNN